MVLSPYDIAATAIGVGAVAPGQACSILGTTLCTEVVADEVRLGEEPAGLTVALGLPGRYLRAFPTFAGGDVVQWACTLLGLDDPEQLGELAVRARPGAGGLCFLPYLSPAGERAPFLDPLVRGTFAGLSFEHGREHVARAVLEGLTLVVRDCLVASRAAPTELRVCGGGAASPLWLQLIADVTGVPVLRSTDTEVGAKGAYLVGLVATGAAARVEDVVDECVRVRDRSRRRRPRRSTTSCTPTSWRSGTPPAPPDRCWPGCGPGARHDSARVQARRLGRHRPRHAERPRARRHRRRRGRGRGHEPAHQHRATAPGTSRTPSEWWRAVSTACRAALAATPGSPVRGVAVDATSGTVLVVDRAGRPLTPALMYDDTRAAAEVGPRQRGRRGRVGGAGLPADAAGVGTAEAAVAAARASRPARRRPRSPTRAT